MVNNKKVDVETCRDYTGWKKWIPTPEEWANFEATGTVPFTMIDNEYLLVYSDENQTKMHDQYCYENGAFRHVARGSIVAAKPKRTKVDQKIDKTIAKNDAKSLKKTALQQKTQAKTDYEGNAIIYPRNDEQVCAFDLMKDDTKTIKLLEGSFGTGKTMIMVNAALEALRLGKFERIIYIRNNVDCVGTKDLGALPGTQNEKMAPWVGPFVDYAGEDAVRTMLATKTLVIEPLQYIRGRNFENSIILCTEAENLLLTNIQLIIARAAEGTQVWFDGDYRQSDRRIFNDSDGLNIMKTTFTGNKLFGCVTLTKSERSETAAMADLLNKVVDEQKLKLLR